MNRAQLKEFSNTIIGYYNLLGGDWGDANTELDMVIYDIAFDAADMVCRVRIIALAKYRETFIDRSKIDMMVFWKKCHDEAWVEVLTDGALDK